MCCCSWGSCRNLVGKKEKRYAGHSRKVSKSNTIDQLTDIFHIGGKKPVACSFPVAAFCDTYHIQAEAKLGHCGHSCFKTSG